MSLILDALNRARRDAGPVPGLDAAHAPERPNDKRILVFLPWAALALALVVIAWLLLRSGGPEPAPEALPAAAQLSRNVGDALTSVRGELEERAAAARNAPAPADRGAPARTEGPAEAAPTPPEIPAAAEPAPQAAAAPSTAPSDEVSELYREASRPPAPPEPAQAPPDTAEDAPAAAREEPAAESGAEEPVDIEEILLRAREEMRQGDMVDHPAPFLVDLSQQTKDEIPTIMYQRHNYGGAPSRSSVVLNGKTLRVGGSAAPGVTVEEILSDSVILSHRGTQFRLRALNSWVNL